MTRLLSVYKEFFQVFANTSYLFTDRLLTTALSLVRSIVIVNYLGAEVFGLFALLVTVLDFAKQVSSLGSATAMLDMLAQYPKKKAAIVISFGIIVFASSILVSFILMGLSVIRAFSIPSFILAAIAGLNIINSSSLIDQYFLHENKLRRILSVSILIDIGFTLALVLLAPHDIDFRVLILLYAIKLLLTYAYKNIALYLDLTPYISMSRSSLTSLALIKEAFHRCKFLSVADLSNVLLMNTDILFLQYYLGPASVGLYKIAINLVNLLKLAPITLNQALRPKLLKLYSTSPDVFLSSLRQVISINLYLSLALMAGTILISGAITDLIYPNSAYNLKPIVNTYALSLIPLALNNSQWHYYAAHNLYSQASLKPIATLLVNIALNQVLITRYGIQGVIWATIVSLTFSSTIVLIFSRETRRLLRITFNAMIPLRVE